MNKIILSLIAIYGCSLLQVVGQSPIDLKTSLTAAKREFNPVTGVLGAFPEEVKFLLTQVEQKKEHIIQQLIFTEGILRDKRVVVAQTGIGKVNAAIATTLLIEHFQPREVIFTGIAGGVNPDLHPGDLIIGTKIAHHDYGTLTADSMLRRPTRNPFTMQENPLYFPCDTGLVRLSGLVGKKDLGLKKINIRGGARPPQIIKGPYHKYRCCP
jgi:adenosylhomocysteine nucleosidase